MRIYRRQLLSRRSFLGTLAALPALSPSQARPATVAEQFRRDPPPVTAADQVPSVMEFEPLARDALPPAHFGFIATGTDGDQTMRLNQEAFGEYGIRAHRFSDLRRFDSSVTVFGSAWRAPIYLSAVSAMRAFHPDAETAVARAAGTRSLQMMLSSGSSTPLEAVMKARGAPVWWQLYPTDDWEVTASIIRRAEKAGCSAVAVTLDSRSVRNNETLRRAMLADNRQCTACHLNNSHDLWRRAPIYAGLDVSRVTALAPPDQSAGFLDRLRHEVKGRLLVKGIVTGEDAALAVEHGVDGVIVSNHGGRNEETLRASLDCLPEVVAAVRGRVPVFIDGGIRRGTDVYKALALGATAVGIGRPQAWGLAAFGQAGVESVLDLLSRELVLIMRQAGAPNVASIRREDLVRLHPPAG